MAADTDTRLREIDARLAEHVAVRDEARRQLQAAEQIVSEVTYRELHARDVARRARQVIEANTAAVNLLLEERHRLIPKPRPST